MKTFFLEFGRCTGPIILPNLRRFTVQGDTSSFRQLFVASSRMFSGVCSAGRPSRIIPSPSQRRRTKLLLFPATVTVLTDHRDHRPMSTMVRELQSKPMVGKVIEGDCRRCGGIDRVVT